MGVFGLTMYVLDKLLFALQQLNAKRKKNISIIISSKFWRLKNTAYTLTTAYVVLTETKWDRQADSWYLEHTMFCTCGSHNNSRMLIMLYLIFFTARHYARVAYAVILCMSQVRLISNPINLELHKCWIKAQGLGVMPKILVKFEWVKPMGVPKAGWVH